MARRRAGGFLRDFQDFINRGNVVDLAIAVVIGGAFGKVIDSIVALVTGAILDPALRAANVESIRDWPAGEVIIALINFLVIAFVVFLIIKALERFKREEAAVAPDPVATQQQLADATNRLAAAIESRQL
ncbi:MAG: large conductance mechanosensitive channel protein MscL [Pegethrix bostrychoides GSE-TBD4-15B]|jgi:large conductance mechanosensitive channel|uniref:Large conductance mechanosensitive channel protein MscL n=1 Tax=Pegethrix bostrychoides GSE-TBD4-15B TaxID=2839662 RepID=A0A951PEC2_9CYAN|nr:large conductance mechanosensitive channel protein MscL [Pegethrix bostrychoides GSE-TBD4-15B]